MKDTLYDEIESEYMDVASEAVTEIETKAAYIDHVVTVLEDVIIMNFKTPRRRARKLAKDLATSVWDSHHE